MVHWLLTVWWVQVFFPQSWGISLLSWRTFSHPRTPLGLWPPSSDLLLVCFHVQGVHGIGQVFLRLGELCCFSPWGLGRCPEGLGWCCGHGEAASAFFLQERSNTVMWYVCAQLETERYVPVLTMHVSDESDTSNTSHGPLGFHRSNTNKSHCCLLSLTFVKSQKIIFNIGTYWSNLVWIFLQ